MSQAQSSVRAAVRIDTIVCGMDFTLEADLACAGAADLARFFGARMMLVHVAADRESQTRARERLAVYTPSWLEGVSTTTIVLYGDPAHEIARLARQERAGLIVIGTHRPEEPLTLWGIEAGLVESAPCPVLALRGRDDARRALDRLLGRRSEHRCAVCARPFDGNICQTCGARIAFEAMEQKWSHELREGRGLMGLGGAQALGPVAAGVPGAPPGVLGESPGTPPGAPHSPPRSWTARLSSFLFRRSRA